MSNLAKNIVTSSFLPLLAAAALGVAQTPSSALAQASRPDPAVERIESFRADFVRGPDIGLWFQRRTDRGLIVADVATSGAITKAGFQEGDRILAVSDDKVSTEVEFIQSVFAEPARLRTVKVLVSREGKEFVVVLSPFRLIEELLAASPETLESLGIVLDERQPKKVVLERVFPRSPAFYAGLRRGDEILTFEGTPLSDHKEFAKLVLAMKPGIATISAKRGEKERFIELEIPKVPDNQIVHPALGRKPASPVKPRTDPGAISPGGEVPRDPKP